MFGIGVLLVNRRRASQLRRCTTTRRRLKRSISRHSAAAPSPRRDPRPSSPSSRRAVEPSRPSTVDEAIVELDEAIIEPEDSFGPGSAIGMAKARAALVGVFSGVRSRAGITSETWDDLEEALLRADVGVRVTDELLDDLRARVKSKEITDPEALLERPAGRHGRPGSTEPIASLHFEAATGSPNVWLFVGVNGVGKTTTIGKVGAAAGASGRNVLMAAGDTFRAAAAEQLGTWAERSGSEIVRGSEGGDPSSVIFDGVERASARRIDLVLADTAGRLHNKTNLMEELRKVRRVADKGTGPGHRGAARDRRHHRPERPRPGPRVRRGDARSPASC